MKLPRKLDAGTAMDAGGYTRKKVISLEKFRKIKLQFFSVFNTLLRNFERQNSKYICSELDIFTISNVDFKANFK